MKDLLFQLCAAVGVPGVNEASLLAAAQLSKYAAVHTDSLGGVVGVIKGESDYNILLDAHIDEIGMLVTTVDDNGFVKVAKIGGIDIRVLPNCRVMIHGTEKVAGVVCSTPPHLKKDHDESFDEIDSIYIDTGLSGDAAKKIISVGSRISFDTKPAELLNGLITAKSLDDRAGCAALIETARRITARGIPPVTVTISLSAQEELGNRGAITSAFAIAADEAVAVDVSFGQSGDLPAEKCGKLAAGPMLGFSPVLSKDVTAKLEKTAEKNRIKIQYEGMGGNTSTNADVISLTKTGIKSGLLSIPLRNMHTAVETVSVSDVTATAELLTAYIFEGGLCHA
ncbi:MAG: hypothetical protein BGN88_00070 [Clostridiales bacterium 43-6]|nr:MAG: hypothetical protein BGN88_00070 [Clostridiales bacterium 43-6]